MLKILDAEEMKLCDARTIEGGVPSRELMERAALSCVEIICSENFDLSHVTVVCGGGNNGGDGMAIASILYDRGIFVQVVFPFPDTSCTEETSYRLAVLREKSIPILTEPDFASSTLIVDALFGIGLKRAVEGELARIINSINESGVPVFAVDIPSGVASDSGKVMGCAVRAGLTAAISNLKRGHVFFPGSELSGKIRICNIGISDEFAKAPLLCVEDSDAVHLSSRPSHSNKGTFGRVLVVGGSVGMAGAAYLSALAAYRSGAGLCDIFCPEENRVIYQTLLPEAILTVYGEDFEETLGRALRSASSVVLGPGLGVSPLSRRIVEYVFENIRVPLVCDADALNIVAEYRIPYPEAVPIIVTPHPGEMARLCGVSVGEVTSDIQRICASYAKENKVICVLKDEHTVISDGEHNFVNLKGCSAMAKGGSGDVLTGIIAALLASAPEETPLMSAVYGVFLHARAGERAAEGHSLHRPLAREIADSVER